MTRDMLIRYYSSMSYVMVLDGAQYREWYTVGKERVSRETRASVSRETAYRSLEDGPLGRGSGHASAPAHRFDHQIVEVARRHSRNARGLSERRRSDAIEFLARLRREALEIGVGKVHGQRERRELREPLGGLALSREIAVVTELDGRARN